MKKPLLLLSFTLLLGVAWSQKITSKNESVADAVVNKDNGSGNLPDFTSPEDAQKIITRIMDVIGLEPNFKIKVANVPNVEADIRHHQRYILYNPEFVRQVNGATQDKWAGIFILAHEIGHHLDGHTTLGVNSRPEIELEADQFAGFVLRRMGATLDQAQLAMHFIANRAASKTHPARMDRLTAIAKGWNKAEAQIEALSYKSKPTLQLESSQN
jgi:Zn-dependent peptidase ImmA (M78 family)